MSNYGKEPINPCKTIKTLKSAQHSGTEDVEVHHTGLTKLEHFAGLALQGMCARERTEYTTVIQRAKIAFDYAQAMCDEAERRAK